MSEVVGTTFQNIEILNKHIKAGRIDIDNIISINNGTLGTESIMVFWIKENEKEQDDKSVWGDW